MEGYAATGQRHGAHCYGEWEGNTFRDAIKAFRDSLTDKYSRDCIDLERMTFWSCRFFDNETDARNSFG